MNNQIPPDDYDSDDDEAPVNDGVDGLHAIARAIKELTEGDDRPRGIEGLTMAIAGDPQQDRSLASSITASGEDVTRALDGIADAIRDLAAAIRERAV